MSATLPPLVQVVQWTQVALLGRDARNFLNKFCTAELKNLPAGLAQEFILLNPKGQILTWGAAMGTNEGLHLLLSGLSAEEVIQHLDKYLFSEDVRMTPWDVAVWLAPPSPSDHTTLGPLLSQQLPTAIADSTTSDQPSIWTAAGNARLIFAASSLAPDAVRTWWNEQFPQETRDLETNPHRAAHAYQTWRIGQRVPHIGQDSTPASLAQELLRDTWSISFTKGCYLGQETVARLDAMGHVNWNLRQLQLRENWPSEQTSDDTARPVSDISLWLDDQAVGQMTSAWQTRALVRIRATASAQLANGRCQDLQFRTSDGQHVAAQAVAIH